MSESVVLRWWVEPSKLDQSGHKRHLEVYGFRVDAFSSGLGSEQQAWPATLLLFLVDPSQPHADEIERAADAFKMRLYKYLEYVDGGSEMSLANPWAQTVLGMFYNRVHARPIPFITRQEILPSLEWLGHLTDGFEEYAAASIDEEDEEGLDLNEYMPTWLQCACDVKCACRLWDSSRNPLCLAEATDCIFGEDSAVPDAKRTKIEASEDVVVL